MSNTQSTPSGVFSVLVVDDDQQVRDIFSRYLQRAGFNVTAVESSEDALTALDEDAYEVAIVDIMLPGMSGEMFILKAHMLYPDMKFLIYTGYVGYHLSDNLEGIGMREEFVLRKPILDLDIVVKAITDVYTAEMMH